MRRISYYCLLVVKIFWFSRFNIEIVTHKILKKHSCDFISISFLFVVNLLIHNLILYSVFKVHFLPFRVWWRIRGSNPWPPACKAGALPAELIPHNACLFTFLLRCRSIARQLHTQVCAFLAHSRALYKSENPAHSTRLSFVRFASLLSVAAVLTYSSMRLPRSFARLV